MDYYTAALQIECTREAPSLFAAGSVLQIKGVQQATVNPASGEMMVSFDRRLVTIGDLVRWIEDQGLTVGSVAQRRVAVEARAATG